MTSEPLFDLRRTPAASTTGRTKSVTNAAEFGRFFSWLAEVPGQRRHTVSTAARRPAAHGGDIA